MKKNQINRFKNASLILAGSFFLTLFIFLHSSLNIFAGYFLSVWTPHLRAIPLIEIGIPVDQDGVPKYRSPLHTEGHYDKDPYIDTIFAPDFTPEKFEQVQVGMSSVEVITLLGVPLAHDDFGIHDPNNENVIIAPNDPRVEDCYRYSSDGKLNGQGDASWYSFLVCYKDGKVNEKQFHEYHD
ncbi:hypothetical protein KBC70_01955 [Candidatus Woesebacteria bacterium]|nr:hypothetical protein [Candidatus Woesebacteria bacterium]